MKFNTKKLKKSVASFALASTLVFLAMPINSEDIATASGWGLYHVYQGSTYLGTFESKNVAIEEAKNWAYSDIKQNNEIVWRFGDNLYKVYQGSIYLGAFESKEAAGAEAIKWAYSEVRKNGNIVLFCGYDQFILSEYYENGSLLMRSYMNKNLSDMSMIFYYDNGNELFKGNSRGDELHGYLELYYEDGSLAMSGNIENDYYVMYSRDGYEIPRDQEWFYEDDIMGILNYVDSLLNYYL